MKYYVLIMEDDFDLAVQWRQAFNEQDIEATLAFNRVEAEAYLSEKHFDALVTDMFISAGDGGLILIGHIREPGLAGTPAWAVSMPILAVTASQKDSLTDALEFATHQGADAVMRKPFTPEELVQRVVELIDDSATDSGEMDADPPDS